jgi:peroxiredoxin
LIDAGRNPGNIARFARVLDTMPSHVVRSLAAAVTAWMIVISTSRVTAVPAAADLKEPGVRTDAPGFSLPDANGKIVRLSDLKGKVVLLDFWATWCAGCKVEIPWYVEFQRKYHARGLASIGMAMDEEGWEKVKPYLAEHPISYPIVIGNLDLLQKRFGLAPNLPITLLIDRRGKVAESHVGMVTKAAFERDIRQLLKEDTRQR